MECILEASNKDFRKENLKSTYPSRDEMLAHIKGRLNGISIHTDGFVIVGNTARHILLVKIEVLKKRLFFKF